MTNANAQHVDKRNSQFDLISALYHALEAVTTYEKYKQDARGDQDSELVNFFEQVKTQNREAAEQAKDLLKDRM